MLVQRANYLSLIAGFVLSALVPSTPHADFAQGVEYYKSGDHMRASVEFLIAAEKGDPRAQLNLGLMYDEGLGVEQDYAQAAKWYGAAADQGIEFAMLNLASLHFEGLGVNQDYAIALRWYEKAAFLGNPTAQYNLGVMHEEGRGTLLNYVQALAWLRLAKLNGVIIPEEELETLRALMTPDEIRAANKQFETLVRQTPTKNPS